MEQNQELTFYYVENKCPSQNINVGWDIWIYLVSRRPQNLTQKFFQNFSFLLQNK